MEVTFTKAAGRRYVMTVVRERGPRLAPRYGPGYDDYLPHDAVHFLVEAEARLSSGVFGQIAAGQNDIFWPADPRAARRQARRQAKRASTAAERADTGRSEQLAGLCQPLWELRAGHRRTLPLWWTSMMPGTVDSPLIDRILGRLDEFAERWHALQTGGSITLSWPRPAGRREASGRAHAGDRCRPAAGALHSRRIREVPTGPMRSPTGPTLPDRELREPKPSSRQPQAQSPSSTRSTG
jgi:hypothetical protein